MNEYGLIGYPLSHSFSKKYFTEKFEREGLSEHHFELFPLEFIGDLSVLLRDHPLLKGLAVTIPYKEQVQRYLSHTDPIALLTGAVNCIRIQNGTLTGYNTDVTGFENSFKPLLQPHHKKALILGTGGASKAAKYVLQKLNIEYKLVSRSSKEGKDFCTYNDIDKDMLNEYQVIINCTPAGMAPATNDKPTLPYEFLTPRNYLFDMIYNPEKTAFLKEGEMHGCIIKNGYEMLVIQAEENWRIWNS